MPGHCLSCDAPSPSAPGDCCETCGDTIVNLAHQQQQQRVQAARTQIDQIMTQAAANPTNFNPTPVEGQDMIQITPELSTMLDLAAASLQGTLPNNLPLPQPNMAGANIDGEWETPPPEAMNPQPDSRHLPTAASCLAKIPRLTIDARSAILHEATLTTKPSSRTFDCCVGEFALPPPYTVVGTLASGFPIYGGPQTVDLTGKIALLKRGQGITFATKALQAQRAGAVAVVVIQNVPVWP